MIDPTIGALVAAIMGGVGLKVIEHFLGRSRQRLDEAARIRDELREQLDDARTEMRELESARDKWREDYYNLREKYVELQTQLTIALQQIKDRAEKAIEKQPPNPI